MRMAGGAGPLARYEMGERIEGSWYAWEGPSSGEAFRIESLAWSGSDLFLDGYSVSYPRRLAWKGTPLWIFPEETGRRDAFEVEGAAGLLCLRVLDGVADRLWRLGPRGRFADSLPPGADARYLVFRDDTPLPDAPLATDRPPAEGKGIRDLLTADGAPPDYLILASRALAPAALALRDYRRNPRRARPHAAAVAYVEDVYREFSGGRASPTGIRDFLRWARSRWGSGPSGPLRHVLLFGSGHACPSL